MKSNKNIFNCSNLSLTSLPKIPKLTNTFILRNNALKNIPRSVQNLSGLDEVYLSGNPFECSCDMTWMVKWLNSLSNETNEVLVRDYRNVKCANGKLEGIPIIFLSDVLLGCYPSRWTLGQKIGVGTAAVFIGLIFVVAVLTIRRSREVKFLLYYYLRLNTVPKDDQKEITNTKKYDAFFCYW